MSRIIKTTGYRELSHVVQTNDGKFYMVDSNDTFDKGFETMVFEWDADLDKVASWADLYCEHFNSAEEMREKHYGICAHLETLLLIIGGDEE